MGLYRGWSHDGFLRREWACAGDVTDEKLNECARSDDRKRTVRIPKVRIKTLYTWRQLKSIRKDMLPAYFPSSKSLCTTPRAKSHRADFRKTPRHSDWFSGNTKFLLGLRVKYNIHGHSQNHTCVSGGGNFPEQKTIASGLILKNLRTPVRIVVENILSEPSERKWRAHACLCFNLPSSAFRTTTQVRLVHWTQDISLFMS